MFVNWVFDIGVGDGGRGHAASSPPQKKGGESGAIIMHFGANVM